MNYKVFNIEFEGIDKCGKDTIVQYFLKYCPNIYTPKARGVISQIAYTKMFGRNDNYQVNDGYLENTLFVFLDVDKRDWEIRCKLTNEPHIDYEQSTKEFIDAFDYVRERLNDNNHFMFFNTSDSINELKGDYLFTDTITINNENYFICNFRINTPISLRNFTAFSNVYSLFPDAIAINEDRFSYCDSQLIGTERYDLMSIVNPNNEVNRENIESDINNIISRNVVYNTGYLQNTPKTTVPGILDQIKDLSLRNFYTYGNNPIYLSEPYKDFYNIGIHYGYTGHRLSVSGETASGGCNAIATINTLSYSLAENLDIMALQRFYSYNYYSLLSESFSEGGSVQNESGVYVGVNWKPFQGLNVMAYSDFAYFAWPKYQAGNSSRAFDNLVQTVYTKDKWTFTARYRLKFRERDNESKTSLIFKNEHRGRMSAAYNDGIWNGKTQVDIAYTQYKRKSMGWMISQTVGLKLKKRFNAIATFGYFDTDDYDSRVYAYERGMLYS